MPGTKFFVCISVRELRALVFLGPDLRKVKNLSLGPTRTRPDLDPVFFFTNIQHPVCTWTYRDQGLTTCNCLFREKNRYAIVSWCLFLSINVPKIKSCRLVEKSTTKVLYVDCSSIVFRF
jgi:hypothetical protein